MSTKLITQLKEAGQDHEFYPTTDEIIQVLLKDLKACAHQWRKFDNHIGYGIIDIGSGNGKVLKAIQAGAGDNHLTAFYAIEKSVILQQQLPPWVRTLGTDFWQQTLLNKKVALAFSNPPYSRYEDWCEKIIREFSGVKCYLVIPRRWRDSLKLQRAIKEFVKDVTVLGEFSFEDAEDRQARAIVELIRLDMQQQESPADRELRTVLAPMVEKYDEAAAKTRGAFRTRDIPTDQGMPARMVQMYQDNMQQILKTIEALGEMDPTVLLGLDIVPGEIISKLQQQLNDMRTRYWNAVLSRMDAVRARLTQRSLNKLTSVLTGEQQTDFTLENIHVVILWILKNVNVWREEQFCQVYERMIDQANVQLYKSNKRTFGAEEWRYLRYNDARGKPVPSHFGLELRVVLDRAGGIVNPDSLESYRAIAGLSDNAVEVLKDIMVVANDLGFPTEMNQPVFDKNGEQWQSGKSRDIHYKDGVLMQVKAFHNGNMHIKFASKFMLALNVEYGRLKGWLRSGDEAAEELNDQTARQFFGSMRPLGMGDVLLLKEPSAGVSVEEQRALAAYAHGRQIGKCAG